MSGTVSMELRNNMLQHYFMGEAAFDTCWVALTRRVPESNADGSQLDEPTVGSYARVELGLGGAFWVPNGYGEVTNADTIEFPAATAYWGLITGWAVCSEEVDGVTLGVGSMLNPLRVDLGQVATVKAGGIIFGLRD